MEKLSVIAKFLQESDWIEGIDCPLAEYEEALGMNYPIESDEFLPSYVTDHVYAFMYVAHNRHELPDIHHANQLHRRLMVGSKLPAKEIGCFRQCQVFVGNHVPPSPQHLPGLMYGWQANVQNPKANPWENHVQFEQIHPYVDGNGRVGRLLWAWDQMHRGNEIAPFLEYNFHDMQRFLNPSVQVWADLSNPTQVRLLRRRAYYKALSRKGEKTVLTFEDLGFRHDFLANLMAAATA